MLADAQSIDFNHVHIFDGCVLQNRMTSKWYGRFRDMLFGIINTIYCPSRAYGCGANIDGNRRRVRFSIVRNESEFEWCSDAGFGNPMRD